MECGLGAVGEYVCECVLVNLLLSSLCERAEGEASMGLAPTQRWQGRQETPQADGGLEWGCSQEK